MVLLNKLNGTKMVNNPVRVILHSASTPDYPDSSEKYDLFGVADIEAWHRKRGFLKCGYHLVIRRTGKIEHGREYIEVGAHTLDHNQDSIGVCYIGTKRPTKEQVESLIQIYRDLKEKYGIDYNNWFGHYEFTDKKECPGVSMEVARALLKLADQ
jgi:N-acetylmuramoyl-L-alanine amidase